MCKQIVFPIGIFLSNSKKVYTPKVSPIYRLIAKKKDAKASEFSQMVQQVGKSLHQTRGEIARWSKILEIQYQEYLFTS